MPASRVPAPLRHLLDLDKAVTKKLCDGAEAAFPKIRDDYRLYMKALEISCHGVPWIALTLISIYLLRTEGAREVQINLLLALFYDIMVVSFLKAIARRNRPPSVRSHDMFLTIGVDKFSFPSGHATRAVLVALFFTQWVFPEMTILLKVPLYVWAASVAISRVLLRRHFILDVAAGVVIGYLEFCLVGLLWLGPTMSKFLGDWIATSAEDEYN